MVLREAMGLTSPGASGGSGAEFGDSGPGHGSAAAPQPGGGGGPELPGGVDVDGVLVPLRSCGCPLPDGGEEGRVQRGWPKGSQSGGRPPALQWRP